MVFEDVADFVYGMVACTQRHDEVASSGFLGLDLSTAFEGDKESGVGIASKMMTEDPKRVEGVPKGASGLGAGQSFNEISPQGFIDAVPGRARFQEKAAALT